MIYYLREKSWENQEKHGEIGSMEYIDLRKAENAIIIGPMRLAQAIVKP